MTAARRIGIDERRARLGRRHHLATRTHETPTQVARDLVALHATDPATVFLSLWSRIDGVRPDDIARALYDDRTLVRMLGMRRTMFVVPTAFAPVVQHSSADAVAARLRRTYVEAIASGSSIADPDSWLAEVEESVVRHLRERGEATGVQLSKAEPRLRTKISYAKGKAYGGEITLTSRILNLLSVEGRIVRGRPGGAWNGSQYAWSAIEQWFPEGLPRLAAAEARVELVGAWLAAFGPGTEADLKWWTGWSLRDVRRALADVDHVEVDLDGTPGFVLASDVEEVAAPEPWVALLPALDPTPMGWYGRDWYLPPGHREQLFDRNGNIGPSIWCDGRIVGGWAQRKDGEIVWRLLEEIDPALEDRIAAEAEALAAWHSEVRVTPRFRTPLEKELTA